MVRVARKDYLPYKDNDPKISFDDAILLHPNQPTLVKALKGAFNHLHSDREVQKVERAIFRCVDSRITSLMLTNKSRPAYEGTSIAAGFPNYNPALPHKEQFLEFPAAIRYVISKGVKIVIIGGHSQCGGVAHHVSSDTGLPEVSAWMKNVCPTPRLFPTRGAAYRAKTKNPRVYASVCESVERECLSQSYRNMRLVGQLDAVRFGSVSTAAIMINLGSRRLELIENDLLSPEIAADLYGDHKDFTEKAWGPDGRMADLVLNGQYPEMAVFTGLSYLVDPNESLKLDIGDAFAYKSFGNLFNLEKIPGGRAAALNFFVDGKPVKTTLFTHHDGDVNDDYMEGKLDQLPECTDFLEKSAPEIHAQRAIGMHPTAAHRQNIMSTHFNVLSHHSVDAAVRSGKLDVVSVLLNHQTRSLKLFNPQTGQFMEVEPPRL